jgi:NADH dehydrogenase FAD-containing subunit
MSRTVVVIGGGYGGSAVAKALDPALTGPPATEPGQAATLVAQNIIARLRGGQPTATYRPLPHPMILLPLGPRGGVGQLPTPDGPAVVPADSVSAYKGADLFAGRFTEQFGAA